MPRHLEIVAFLAVGAIVCTIGFQFYHSPDGEAVRDAFSSSPVPKPDDSDWMKEFKTPEWKFDQNSIVLPHVTFDGVDGSWDSTKSTPSAPPRATTQNQLAPEKSWDELTKEHRERMRAHDEHIKEHRELIKKHRERMKAHHTRRKS